MISLASTFKKERDVKLVMQVDTLPADFADIKAKYDSNTQNTSVNDIETNFRVGDIGSAGLTITATNRGVFLQEAIQVDTTSSQSFWGDIQNWLFAKNLHDLVKVGDTYEIRDRRNRNYVAIF